MMLQKEDIIVPVEQKLKLKSKILNQSSDDIVNRQQDRLYNLIDNK